VLDRLELMRLLSALMAGLTALFVFLFIREALPGVPWAWTVGGLGVALAPLLGFNSGVVNPDAMLFAVSAAAFYCLARAFRRGLTPKLAIAIGVVTAVGFLTKLNFIGLAPGVLLGLIALTIRSARTSGHAAYRSLALALAIAGSPIALDIVVNQLSNHPTLGLVSSAASSAVQHNSVLSEISYIWQLYLPRLPLMHDDFPHILTTRVLWFNGLVGRYGWGEVLFPPWVDDIALIPAGLIAILCTRTLLTSRAVLRHRPGELIVYFVTVAGLPILIGTASYSLFPAEAATFPEPRYLLPMLPLMGAVLALAARGAGRCWGPPVGALIVVLFLAHDLFSQLQVIARFYG
jgi:4-amino-4-deoxy-L-arabinose transferase-like glycosyltransferase